MIGTKSICDTCGREVIFLGKYWDHTGKTYRHPANPSDVVLLTIKIANKKQELLALEGQLNEISSVG